MTFDKVKNNLEKIAYENNEIHLFAKLLFYTIPGSLPRRIQ